MNHPPPTSILIIDDNLNFLMAISVLMEEQYGDQIRIIATAQNGLEGIHLAGRLLPQVVLLDLKMPDMHGFTVIPLLRQVLPEIKIITTTLLTSGDFEQFRDIYRQESLKAGADHFIPKYQLEHELVPAVLNLINPLHNLDNNLITSTRGKPSKEE